MHDQQKMASFSYSEQDVLQLYTDSISSHREDLVQLLRTGQWEVPLIVTGCLTQDEWGSIEASSGSGREKRTNRAKAILDLVQRKNTFACYNGFSRVVVDKNRHKAEQIFPFVRELEMAGLHEPYEKNAQPSHRTASTDHNKPVIVWVVSSEEEYKAVKKLISGGNHPYDNMGFSCQEFSIGSAALILAYRKQPSDSSNLFADFLSSLNPPPQLAVLTASCQPLRESTVPIPGQVVMVTSKDPCCIYGEVEFMCELWRLGEGSPDSDEDNTCRLAGLKMAHVSVEFGRATKWAADDSCLVQCREAVEFYLAARKVHNLECLAAVQVEDRQASVNTAENSLNSKLMYNIVTYYSDERLLS